MPIFSLRQSEGERDLTVRGNDHRPACLSNIPTFTSCAPRNSLGAPLPRDACQCLIGSATHCGWYWGDALRLVPAGLVVCARRHCKYPPHDGLHPTLLRFGLIFHHGVLLFGAWVSTLSSRPQRNKEDKCRSKTEAFTFYDDWCRLYNLKRTAVHCFMHQTLL